MNKYDKIDKSVARRSLHYYFQELKKHRLLAVLTIVSQPLEIFFMSFALPFIVAQILDILIANPPTAEQVWPVFGPYLLAAAGVVVLGLICQKHALMLAGCCRTGRVITWRNSRF